MCTYRERERELTFLLFSVCSVWRGRGFCRHRWNKDNYSDSEISVPDIYITPQARKRLCIDDDLFFCGVDASSFGLVQGSTTGFLSTITNTHSWAGHKKGFEMAGGFRVLHLVRPFLSFLPEIQTADRKVPFREKVMYTVVSLFIFLVCISCHSMVFTRPLDPILSTGCVWFLHPIEARLWSLALLPSLHQGLSCSSLLVLSSLRLTTVSERTAPFCKSLSTHLIAFSRIPGSSPPSHRQIVEGR